MRPTAVISISVVLAALAVGLLFQKEAGPVEGATVWRTFDEGVRLAEKENKKILIDVYTDWCSWCKKMDKEVYGDEGVAQVLNARFIGVKLNAESSKLLTFGGSQISEAEFARGAGVTGYPTTLFLDSKSTPITSLPGFVKADRFKVILSYIGEDHYKKIPFADYLANNAKKN